MPIYYYDMPIGKIGIEETNGFITRLWKINQLIKHDNEVFETKLIKDTKYQLDEYFAGIRKEFSIPIKPNGTDYMLKIWKQLVLIPYGKTLSYGEIAQITGNNKGARSVGMACGKNPILMLIPCHRIIGSNGSLTGFSCGLETKIFLLKLEDSYKG